MNMLDMLAVMSSSIVEECLKRGVEIVVSKHGVKIDGFYKSGCVWLSLGGLPEHKGKIIAVSRYGEVTLLESIKDLLELNLYWWEFTQERNSQPISLDSPWLEMAIEQGIVEEKATVSYRRIK